MNRRNKAEALAWESRWARWVAAATFLAVVMIVVSTPLGSFGNGGEAEILRESHANPGRILISSLLQGFGVLLLMIPLYYLFRVVRTRSPKVRAQLVGLVIAAPIFLAVSAGLGIGARDEAATAFVHGDAKPTLSANKAEEECKSDSEGKSASDFADEYEPKAGETAMAACEREKTENDAASNAVGEASLAPIVSGLGIAGSLGFLVAMVYSCLWALRTGVLTRFWASLGMASGIAFLLGPLFIVTMVWLVYFAVLVAGLLPRGKPPAWAAGEAVPWPTAGDRMAKELEPKDYRDGDEDGDGTDPGLLEAPEPDEAPEAGGAGDPGEDDSGSEGPGQDDPPQRRKRKRRSS